MTVDLADVQVTTAQPRPAASPHGQIASRRSRACRSDTAAKRLDVAEIRLTDLTTGVTLLPGAPTTQTVAQVVVQVRAESKPAATQTNAFQVKIDEVALENASFHFTDESVEPHVESAVEEFSGSVKGLTSDMNTVAVVDFAGKVNKYAPFSIKGKINPLASDMFVDVAILLQNDALTPTSPYASKYVGFPLESGGAVARSAVLRHPARVEGGEQGAGRSVAAGGGQQQSRRDQTAGETRHRVVAGPSRRDRARTCR